ncbi:MAG TPA: PrsW family glutamic-type intramembrane protease, partial [Ktedonobacterales bacterium]|nr:PrsW family glutamic-type intramembrane protease [Ktedonobacterales bacterium]
MQSANSLTGMQTMLFAPPYPAALSIPSAGWRSHLARDGKIPLAKPVIQIGRMEGNDVVLSDPLVSRHHAVVRWSAGGYELEDLAAPNGTFIEGQRVTGRVGLAPGNLVRLGGTEMVFQVMSPDQPGPDANATGPADPNTTSGFVVRPALPGADALGPAGRRVAAPAPPPSSAAPPPPRSLAAPFPQPGAPAMGAGPSPIASSAHPYYAMMAQPAQGRLAGIFRSQARMRYWRVFLLGLIAYAVVAQVTASTANLHLAPLEMLLASALVPVVFVIFCWEQNAFVDMPPAVVGITFASGAVLGISIAAIVEPLLIPNSVATTGITLPIAVIIGLVEETAKVISVAWFLRNRRLRSELDGLILGAAAGMGFSALETAGYGFAAFLQGFFTGANSPVATLSGAVHAGSSNMNHELLVRMALAVFGHGVWTAIVCAAIWRDRGQSTFRLTAGVMTAFGIAVGLHALWDWSPLIQTLGPQPSRSSL